MKFTITNETTEVLLHKSDIKEVNYEDWFTKDGENKSYFLVYFNNPLCEMDKLSCLVVKIPFNFENIDGEILPTYKQEITSCEFNFDEDCDSVNCELTEDEKSMLVDVCIRELLSNFACMEFKISE